MNTWRLENGSYGFTQYGFQTDGTFTALSRVDDAVVISRSHGRFAVIDNELHLAFENGIEVTTKSERWNLQFTSDGRSMVLIQPDTELPDVLVFERDS